MIKPESPRRANGEGSEKSPGGDSGAFNIIPSAVQVPPIIARHWWRRDSIDLASVERLAA